MTLGYQDLLVGLANGVLADRGTYELTYNDLSSSLKLPLTRSINGNGATIRLPKLLPKDDGSGHSLPWGVGTVFTIASSNRIRVSDIRLVSDTQFDPKTKSGWCAFDVMNTDQVSLERCSADGMFALLRHHVGRHSTMRDCVATNGFYGFSVESLEHFTADNLWCENVVRSGVVMNSSHVDLDLTVKHDGVYPRLETDLSILSFAIDDNQPSMHDIRVRIGVDGTVWRLDEHGSQIDQFRAVGIEFQGPSTAHPATIDGVELDVRFTGRQGGCAAIGFAKYNRASDGSMASQSTVGKHSFGRTIVRGAIKTGSPLVNSRVNPGVVPINVQSSWYADLAVRV
jgi:hypothetical protein